MIIELPHRLRPYISTKIHRYKSRLHHVLSIVPPNLDFFHHIIGTITLVQVSPQDLYFLLLQPSIINGLVAVDHFNIITLGALVDLR